MAAETSNDCKTRDIESIKIGDCKSGTLLQECGKIYMLPKLIQYRIIFPEDDEERLQLLASPVALYMKNLRDARPKTINFTMWRNRTLSECVYLVLESKTFNISGRIGEDVFVLCAPNIPTHTFFIRFANRRSAAKFFSSSFVWTLLDNEIDCPTAWVTPDILQRVYSL